MLLGSELFRGRDKGEADDLLALVELRSFATGEQIIAAGEIATHVLMVPSGLMRVTLGSSGRDIFYAAMDVVTLKAPARQISRSLAIIIRTKNAIRFRS